MSRFNHEPLTLRLQLMPVSDEFKDYIELSVDVFKAQDPKAIQALKNFLTVLPKTAWIETILSIAVDQLAEDAPNACRWLLQHSEYLQPEFDLSQKVQQDLLQTLESLSFELDRDFRIEQEHIQLSEIAKAELRIRKQTEGLGFSVFVMLLLEDLLEDKSQ